MAGNTTRSSGYTLYYWQVMLMDCGMRYLSDNQLGGRIVNIPSDESFFLTYHSPKSCRKS